MEITKLDYAKFIGQSVVQAVAKLSISLLGMPIVAVGILHSRFPQEHPFYDFVGFEHTQEYKNLGSSGYWKYERLPDWAIMKPFDNLNYGLRGEPKGRWSAKKEGKEDTFGAKWRQAAIRNPSNGLRYIDFFSCQVDNCDIVYKGDFGPLDIQPKLVTGRNFVKARDKDSGRTYYSFQYVRAMGKKHAFRFRVGFKVEPSHTTRGDLPPRKERATFTTRINIYKPINAWEQHEKS